MALTIWIFLVRKKEKVCKKVAVYTLIQTLFFI